jgi:hypothetical protein
MTEKFNLSEKIIPYRYGKSEVLLIPAGDVKEFIRLLKEEIKVQIKVSDEPTEHENILIEIDKLAGGKLK